MIASALANDPVLDRKVAAACLEVTANASRHGDASELDITLEIENDPSLLRIIAQDNGWGLSESPTAGFGLQHIEVDGGHWEFASCAEGAKLFVEFPLVFDH